MGLTIWSNHELRAGEGAWLARALAEAGHRLVMSAGATRLVLQGGGSDSALAGADVVLGQPAPEDVLAAPGVRWIEISTAGYARYDRPEFRAAMQARGTVVTNSSAVFANPCAEHVLAGMLAVGRELPKYVRNQAGPREWGYLEGRYSADTLTGKTVVLLGFGAIGRRLAELLAPFRCRVIAVRRSPRGDEGVEVVAEARLAEALAAADHVVNLLPDASGTRGYCDAARFAAMKRGVHFHNIGRGSTVRADDLLAALRSGQVGSAWLDALDPEPLPPDDPLWRAPNCHITPHVGGGHRDQDLNLARHFVDNLRRFERGEPLVDRVM
ncbi:MAG: D-2-hydroxyacid dehydrogenase [Opitutaceae bacterium]|nr:D-2-hydroxyacid dehydrogenase [Opitutaceae bacterium]